MRAFLRRLLGIPEPRAERVSIHTRFGSTVRGVLVAVTREYYELEAGTADVAFNGDTGWHGIRDHPRIPRDSVDFYTVE